MTGWCPMHIIDEELSRVAAPKQGAAGVEPATSRSAVECSATELYPLTVSDCRIMVFVKTTNLAMYCSEPLLLVQSNGTNSSKRAFVDTNGLCYHEIRLTWISSSLHYREFYTRLFKICCLSWF